MPSITILNYRKLDEDMLEFIDFCITHSTTGTQNIEQLLKNSELDASNLLLHMYNLKTSDSRWFIEARFDGPKQRLCSLIFFPLNSSVFGQATDNCNYTRLVATALLKDETEKSFIWALHMINKCTGNLVPQVIYMNSDPAI
ncbi:16430_t:CDS:2 [Gigaspora rosea]|nr:16430_t:CDS:2 [Gigaspora rosea]